MCKLFLSCLSTDVSVEECSITSKSAVTDNESKSGKRGRGRPRKFVAPPYLDGCEQREQAKIPSVGGRPKKVQKRGRPRLHSDAAEQPDIEVAPEDPVQPAADPVRVANAREGN
jgi:AT hook motif